MNITKKDNISNIGKMFKYKIEILLDNLPWSKTRMSEILGILPNAVNEQLKRRNIRIQTYERYTEAFNKIFDSDYSRKELFTIEENLWEQKEKEEAIPLQSGVN